MKKISTITFFTLALFTSSCVSTKVFNDLESRYATLKVERNTLEASRDSIQKARDLLGSKWKDTNRYLKRSRDSVSDGLQKLRNLEKEYTLLEQNSDKKIQSDVTIADLNAAKKETQKLKKEIEVLKREVLEEDTNEELEKAVSDLVTGKIETAIKTKDKADREKLISELKDEAVKNNILFYF